MQDDLVLDVIDRVADPVREREVAVDQVVGDRPQQVVRPVARGSARLQTRRWWEARGSHVRSWAVSRNPSPSTRSISVMTTSSVYSRLEHHDVHDAVGQLDLGALVALEDVLDDERMQRQERADLLRPGRRTVRSGPPTPTRRSGAGARAARRGRSCPPIPRPCRRRTRRPAPCRGPCSATGGRRRATGSPARPVGAIRG